MTSTGFVKIPREITERKWFGDGATLKVFVFLLCNAMFRTVEAAGRILFSGQYITSVSRLAKFCQLTVQQTRTALNHLRQTNDITIETTPKFSIITVNCAADPALVSELANKLANTLVNTQFNNRSRSKEIQEIQEEVLTRDSANESACCANREASSSIRELLVGEYGEAAVCSYEERFRNWAAKKASVHASMYPAIEKWMAADIRNKAAHGVRSSLDIEGFESRILEQYKKK